jgi:hypothetical protein
MLYQVETAGEEPEHALTRMILSNMPDISLSGQALIGKK